MSGIIEMEFSGRGNGWTTVTDVLRGPGITWHRGLPGSSILDLVADIGTLSFSLDNSERNSVGLIGYYSPDHENRRSGFELNIRVRYRIGSIIRFTGVLDSITPITGRHGPRTVSCEVVDWMDVAQRTRLENLPVQINKRGDEIFQVLIDSIPIVSQPDALEMDLSADIFPYSLDRTRDEQTVLRDEIYRLCISGLDRCWIRGDGTVVYESRTRRAISATNADVYDDHFGFVADRDRTSLINKVQSTVHPRVPGSSYVVMFSMKQPMELIPGQTITILGPWTDPDNPDVRVGAADLAPITATTDYTANTASDGSGTNLTGFVSVTIGFSGNATEFSVTYNGGVTGYLTKLQQRGKPLYDYGATVMQWKDDTSIAQYGPIVQQIDMVYQADPRFGLEAAQYFVFSMAFPITQVSGLVRFVGLNSDALELARSLDRDISDRIGLTDYVTGITRSFYINSITETEQDNTLRTEFTLVPADSTAFWLLEIEGLSELDGSTRLGFGLIVGHTDVAHSDVHQDTAHGDIAHSDTHTDDAHQDVAHGDAAHADAGTHGDVAHSDVAHGDAAHSDRAHTDTAHSDTHGDTAHSDVAHSDSHSDVAHSDIAHEDSHSDSHVDREEFFDSPGHIAHGDSHTDSHSDSHSDSAHVDSHSDTAHSDVALVNTHSDVAHADVSHGDTAHSDTAHSDIAAHADGVHSDTAHSDSAHADTAHGDVAHTDVLHTDTPHGDQHSDIAHGDLN